MAAQNPLGNAEAAIVIGAGLVAVALVYVVMRKGVAGTAQAAASGVASAAVGAVQGAAVGTVDGVSQAVGIPTTEQTTTDPGQARWIIDNYGQWEASQWASAGAYLRALWMDAGTGTPPPAGSAFAVAHPETLQTRPIDFGYSTDGVMW
ncbi:hypothetical protein [Roseateles sp.]|uniref:hypothetical protein n=1 Tax=Roseateles sp. TaxID=1971397 RepID=UPI002DF79F2F|nr:hypothetical protein [Roseateles sp.]